MNVRTITALIVAGFITSLSTGCYATATSDPLNNSELSLALQATQAMMNTPRLQHAARNTSASSQAILSMEQLLVERRPTDKEQPEKRLADVYSYDYSVDETVHAVVDVATGEIISSERLKQQHLPLTVNEIARARQLVFANAEQSALIKQEYKRITGSELTNPDSLNIKAFSFSADSLPERLNAASQQCGVQRCAQVLLYTHDDIVFEVSPIVNLSVGLVTQTIGF